MKRAFSSLVVLYGLGLSTLFFCGLVADMGALDAAFRNGSERAELRHRINVFADGTWFMLANLITIAGAYGTYSSVKKKKEES
jgi:hypothetical protein